MTASVHSMPSFLGRQSVSDSHQPSKGSIGVAAAVEKAQVTGVGLILAAASPLIGQKTAGLTSSAGYGIALTLLLAIIVLLWPLRRSGASEPPLFGRMAQAAASVMLAFAVVRCAEPALLTMETAHAPLLLWCVLSSATAALLQLTPTRKPPVFIVGTASAASVLARRLQSVTKKARLSTIDVDCANDLRQLDDIVAEGRVCTVIFSGKLDKETVEAFCLKLAGAPIRVLLAPAIEALPNTPFAPVRQQGRVETPMIDLLPPPIIGWRRIVKRGFDLLAVLLLLPILAPVFVIIAFVIKFESPGPILFRQWRFGLGSQPVLVYKFRTMRADLGDSTGAARTIGRDPRVTMFGRLLRRLSLDELPQLLNVLQGDMSLVGPRPHAVRMMVGDKYYFEAVDFYSARHRMPPGMTGWAQINGSRGEFDSMDKAQRRLDLDLWYIANWSPVLDLWIILRTACGGFATLRAD